MENVEKIKEYEKAIKSMISKITCEICNKPPARNITVKINKNGTFSIICEGFCHAKMKKKLKNEVEKILGLTE